jgi:hypothetical protein
MNIVQDYTEAVDKQASLERDVVARAVRILAGKS